MASSLLHRLDGQRASMDILDESNPYSLASSMTDSSENVPEEIIHQSEAIVPVVAAEKVLQTDVENHEDISSDLSLPSTDIAFPVTDDASSTTETNIEVHDIVRNVGKGDEMIRHPLEIVAPLDTSGDVSGDKSGDVVTVDDLPLGGLKRKDKRVSFRSEDDSELVTDFVNAPDPWRFADQSSTQNVMQAYAHMCLHNNVQPLPKVLESIKRNPGGRHRSGIFDLSGETIDLALVDTLEAIFMRMCFEELNLDGCLSDDELAVALMDMLEYYQMADKLVVSNNRKLQFRGWLAIAKNLKNCCLYYFDARGCVLTDQFASLLSRAFRCGTNLVTLHLENCCLSGRPAFLLVSALQFSDTIQEIFLGDNRLTPNDMIHVASALKHGWRIRVLDLRNNPIMNSGAAHLLDSISESSVRALVLYNTCITSQIAKTLSRTLFRSRNLETLNLGSNDLTDETIFIIKEALLANRTIRRLGLQAVKISDEGCIALAEFLADQPRFLRLDIRHNDIKAGGWLALSHAAKISPSLVRMDMSYDLRDMKHTETIRGSLQTIQAACLENFENFEKSLLVREVPVEEEEEESVFQGDNCEHVTNGDVSGNAHPTEITVTSPTAEPTPETASDPSLPDTTTAPEESSPLPAEMDLASPTYPEFIGSFGQEVDTNLDIDIPRKKCTQLGRRRSSISSVTATGPLSVCDRLTEELFPSRPPVLPAPSQQPVIRGRFQISLVKATEKIYQSVQSVLSPTSSIVGTPIGTITDGTDGAGTGHPTTPQPPDGKGLFNWRATFRRGSKEIPQVELPIGSGEGTRSPDRTDFQSSAVKSSS